MATKQDLARNAWPVLVAFARARRTITYGELSKEFIGGAPVGMGKPLGIVRNEAVSRGLPMINSIAVGRDGVPADKWYHDWNFYSFQANEEKRRLLSEEQRKVFNFLGWDSVLIDLKISPEQARRDELPPPRAYGSGDDESPEHKRLKEIVRQDPSLLRIMSVTNATTEFPLPSGDEVDVYVEATDSPRFHVIEVKVNDPAEIRRGVYQAIKYRAVATAWKNLDLGTNEVVAHLVTTIRVEDEILTLAREYEIQTHVVSMGLGMPEITPPVLAE
jgi:hypothetical protein